jgi:hypothetical protein
VIFETAEIDEAEFSNHLDAGRDIEQRVKVALEKLEQHRIGRMQSTSDLSRIGV